MAGIVVKSDEDGVQLLRKMSEDIKNGITEILSESGQLLDNINEYPVLGPHKNEIINIVLCIKDGMVKSVGTAQLVAEKLEEKADELQEWINDGNISDTSFLSTNNTTQNGVVSSNNPSLSSTDSSREVIEKYGESWASSLSPNELNAVKVYTGNGYSNINATLRGISDGYEPGMREHSENLHIALSRASTPCNYTVYRGASEAALGDYNNLSDEELVGHVIRDRGFMSTSLDKERAFGGNIQFIIDVPAGSHGAYVSSISSVGKYEEEVLLDKGQMMRILDVSRDSFGRRVIHVEIRSLKLRKIT